ncbi:restriction endonuclease subunit S [Curtobacterium sp. S6]|uniref:restriction endonuclease subunit S n=1 Tax=Curtobacterium sp. S6 TaxID=1479623 RepID=UPI00128FBD0A|nr:restriction endonuclease subunit S [Curtobacterium sp. S6]
MSDSAFPALSVTKQGVVPQLGDVAKSQNGEARKLVRAGDFVINSRSDRKGSSGISELDGSVSVVYTVLRPREGLDLNFTHHLLRSSAFQEEFYRWGSGIVADLWSTRYSAMKRIALPIPPLDEQRAIADYLGRETQKIDELITEQRSLIETLRERRDSLSHQFFGAKSEITAPLKQLVDEITVGIVVTPAKWYEYGGGGVPALRGANVKRGYIDPTSLVHLSREGDQLHRKSRLKSGDVVVVRTGQAGAAAVVPNTLEGFNAIDLLIIRAKPSLCSDFLEAFLNSHAAAAQITDGSVGAIQSHFNVSALRRLRIPDIGTERQLQLVDRWKSASSRIDELISESEDLIALSQERRAALITAAVTGQIDVRTAS